MNLGPFVQVCQLYLELLVKVHSVQYIAQVIEQQPQSDLPHLHGVGWMKNLPDDTTQLLFSLQQENAFMLTNSQLVPVVGIGRAALTVSTLADDILRQFPQLSPAQSDTVAKLSLSVQQHSCSDRCMNHGIPGQVCKGFFPQLPSLLCMVARTPLLDDPGKERLSAIYGIHTRLQELLRRHTLSRQEDNTATLLSLLRQLGEQPETLPDQSGYTWQSLNFPSTPDFQRLTLRPGHSIAEGESGYFVHQRTEVRSDNCKFHSYCKRTPLDDWSHR